MLLWQPIKISTEQNNHLPNKGPLKEHFRSSFVKISVMAFVNGIFFFFYFPITIKSMATSSQT